MKYVADIDMVCILGATASGKTRLAAALAAATDGEIISADSRQVYRGMNIGTGKDLGAYVVNGKRIPYHLIDIVDPGQEFSIFDFQRAFLNEYKEIRSRNKLVILCGGSGMYLDSVLFRYRLVHVPEEPRLRAELEKESDERLIERLSKLRRLHNITDITDRNRLIRAIEIETYSRAHPDAAVEFPRIRTKVYGIRWKRSELRRRITARLKERLESGLIQEVGNLLDSGLSSEHLDSYGLEYRYVTQYVCGKLNGNDMFQKLNAAIHKFAKKQETWFRRMEKKGISIIWIPGELPLKDKLVKLLERGKV
ncbi:MAG: tRNA (adenosine(37)-N6)-dimethylallyltransferase MiaA [Candidatus Tritonobacter lacicola]|nr:tRNA (adenosine(37)-N6)-dimethylallyltransferase MiaA [Candidatus Tritonobacter lacicola]